MASVFEADSEAKKLKEAEKLARKKRDEWQRDVALGVNPFQVAESEKARLAMQFNNAANIEQDKLGKKALSNLAAEEMDKAAFEAEAKESIEEISANGLDKDGFPQKASLAGLTTTLYNEHDEQQRREASDATGKVRDELSRNLSTYREEQNRIDLGKLGYSVHGVSAEAQALIDDAHKQADIALKGVRGYNLVVTPEQRTQALDVVRDFERLVQTTVERDLNHQRQQQLTRFAPGTRVEPGQETAPQQAERQRLEREEQERTRKLAAQLSRGATANLVKDHSVTKKDLDEKSATQLNAFNKTAEANLQIFEQARQESMMRLQQQLHAAGPNVAPATQAQEVMRQQRKEEQRVRDEEKVRKDNELAHGPGSNDPNGPEFGGDGDGSNGVGIEEDPFEPDNVGAVNIQIYAADASGRAVEDHGNLVDLGADGKVAAESLGIHRGPGADTLDGVENNGYVKGIEPMYLHREPAHYDPNDQ